MRKGWRISFFYLVFYFYVHIRDIHFLSYSAYSVAGISIQLFFMYEHHLMPASECICIQFLLFYYPSFHFGKKPHLIMWAYTHKVHHSIYSIRTNGNVINRKSYFRMNKWKRAIANFLNERISPLNHISHLSPLQMLVIIMMTTMMLMMINLRIQMYKYILCMFIFRHVVKFIKKFYHIVWHANV